MAGSNQARQEGLQPEDGADPGRPTNREGSGTMEETDNLDGRAGARSWGR